MNNEVLRRPDAQHVATLPAKIDGLEITDVTLFKGRLLAAVGDRLYEWKNESWVAMTFVAEPGETL